jgi:hypothetical protein
MEYLRVTTVFSDKVMVLTVKFVHKIIFLVIPLLESFLVICN